MQEILNSMEDAEEKAWKALAGYKFWMFGYHASRWVNYNKLLKDSSQIEMRKFAFKKNPFTSLISKVRAICSVMDEKPRRIIVDYEFKITFKDKYVMHNFCGWRIHPTITEVIYNLPGNIVITSAFRNGDDGVHGTEPLRGVDLRGNYANEINSEWIYDPKRPQMKVAIYHDTGSGWHTHVQVHPNTIRI